MNTYRVYLSGPITGLSYEGAVDWREAVRRELPSHIVGISPMRAKDFLKDRTDLKAECYPEYALSAPKGVVTRDRFDTMRCNVMLLNLLGASRVSIGSMIEIGWADAARVPIVLVMEKEGNPHMHAMVQEMCGYWVYTLEEGVQLVKAILTP